MVWLTNNHSYHRPSKGKSQTHPDQVNFNLSKLNSHTTCFSNNILSNEESPGNNIINTEQVHSRVN